MSSTPQQQGLEVDAQVHRGDVSSGSSTTDTDEDEAGAPANDDDDWHSLASVETALMDGQGEDGLMADLRQDMDQITLASQDAQGAQALPPPAHVYESADAQGGSYQNVPPSVRSPPIPARRQFPGMQSFHLPGDPRTQVVVHVHQASGVQGPPPPPPRPAMPEEEEEPNPLDQTLPHAQVLRINARRLRRDAIHLAHLAADFFVRRPR